MTELDTAREGTLTLNEASETDQEAFFDAVADAEDMTADQKVFWLHICAKEYFRRWQDTEADLRAARAVIREAVGALQKQRAVHMDVLTASRGVGELVVHALDGYEGGVGWRQQESYRALRALVDAAKGAGDAS